MPNRNVIITKNVANLAEKSESLRNLADNNLCLPNTIIIPEYSCQDIIPIEDFGEDELLYTRICFYDRSRRVGKIINRDKLQLYVQELEAAYPLKSFDLVIQPFIQPTYSGAVAKYGGMAIIEITQGLAPTLFHRGRVCFQCKLIHANIVNARNIKQDIGLHWVNGTLLPYYVNEQCRTGFIELCSEVMYSIRDVDKVLLEWSLLDDEVVFYDERKLINLPGLNGDEAEFPRSLTLSSEVINQISSDGKKLNLEFPDIQFLNQIKDADIVIIQNGALLSHLSVYSLEMPYNCIFQ